MSSFRGAEGSADGREAAAAALRAQPAGLGEVVAQHRRGEADGGWHICHPWQDGAGCGPSDMTMIPTLALFLAFLSAVAYLIHAPTAPSGTRADPQPDPPDGCHTPSGTSRSSGPTYSANGRTRVLAARCSKMCAVHPSTRAATKSGVKVAGSNPMRW